MLLVALLKALFSNGPGIQLLRGHRDFIPSHATGALSLPSLPYLCTELQVISHHPHPCIVIHRPSVCEGQQYERGHEREKSQSEGRDEMRCDGLACRGEGRDEANQICTPYKKSTDEMALLLWQHTFRSGIFGCDFVDASATGFLNRVSSQTT